ncbi:hypothetical protein JCM10213_005355 [Rhodosporidiobolus nylandii]
MVAGTGATAAAASPAGKERLPPSDPANNGKHPSTRTGEMEKEADGLRDDTGPADGAAAQTSWRDRLPKIVEGPMDALFPHFSPNALYSAPPAFITSGNSRLAWRSRKHLLRAMIVLLASFILVLNPDSLTVLGQASFFGMIVSVMLPPTFPAQVYLLVATTLVLGMCVGWAWGCAAMAAALRARSQLILASAQQRVQAGIAGATNPDVEYRLAIFQGEFLDWRSTLVFGVFLWIGLFALGLIRAKGPQATFLLAIFGSIVMDVMCSYGPLFPFQQYTLATTFLIPTACFLAIAIASNVLIFPETLNSTWTTDLVDKFLSPVLQRSQLHSKLLSTPPPPFHSIMEKSSSPSSDKPASPWSPFGAFIASTQEALSAALEGLLGGIPMLELEVSYGKLSAKDLASLTDVLREMHVRAIGLGVLYTTVQSRYKRYLALQFPSSSPSASTPSHSAQPSTASKALAYTETARMQRARERFGAAEQRNNHDLRALLPIFETASSPLRTATDAALEGAMSWLIEQNNTRWGILSSRMRISPEEAERRLHVQQEKVAQLEAAIRAYRADGREALVEPFQDFFDPKTGKLLARHPRDADGDTEDGGAIFAPGSLFTLLSASDNLVVFAEAVLAFVKKAADLQQRRRQNKLWWPTGLRKIGKLLVGGKKGIKATGEGEDPDTVEDVGEEHDEEGAAGEKSGDTTEKVDERGLDPDARPPKNALQRFTFSIYRFAHFFCTPEGLFALKYATFSICIWLPQIFRPTAYLMYSEKSLWALITFQTFLAIYAGDQILATLQKVVGIAVGLVYGMLIWYLGSASGPGSPYGLGAAVFVFMIPAMAIRIFAPPASSQAAIQAAVTTILIVGYSWQDTHLANVGNPGVGYTLAWKRALLVIIGTGVAAVAMVLPPVSTRSLVRRTHATCIQEIGRVHSLIVSAWMREEQDRADPATSRNTASTPFSPAAQKAARARLLALRVKLNATRAAILQSGYEISLRGDWPAGEYSQLLTLQLALLQALAQLGQALVRLSPEWRKALVHETAFLNQPLIADVTSTFSLLSLALRQGCPLPQATPGPLLDRLLYHDRRLRLLSDESASPPASSASSSSASHGKPAESEEGARISASVLTFDGLRDERFGIYASALQALASILLDIDELERVTKGLVGEVKSPGYDRLVEQRVYERV